MATAADLFPAMPTHDPGGKVRHAMPSGMVGGADLTPCARYRIALWRSWSTDDDAPYILWIGMNPSTADSCFNDPTITREIAFTRRIGLSKYVKVNVADYRATNPAALLAPGVEPRSVWNLPAILDRAHDALYTVLAFGALSGRMRSFAEHTVAELREREVTLYCLGTSRDGSPRHPLYLKSDTPLVEWEGWKGP